MKRLYPLLFLAATLSIFSCNTGNKLASSFGKRKYTRGYFTDVPASVGTPNSMNITVHESKTENLNKPKEYSVENTEANKILVPTEPRVNSFATTESKQKIIKHTSKRSFTSIETPY